MSTFPHIALALVLAACGAQSSPEAGPGNTTSTATGDETTWGEGSSSSEDPHEVCGNGALDPGEICDDGNVVPGDGCDDKCSYPASDLRWVGIYDHPNSLTVSDDIELMSEDHANAVVPTSNGGVFVAGRVGTPAQGIGTGDALVALFGASGKLLGTASYNSAVGEEPGAFAGDDDEFADADVDHDGNLVVVGQSGTSYASDWHCILLQKYSQNELRWTFTPDCDEGEKAAHRIVVDGDNHLIVAGQNDGSPWVRRYTNPLEGNPSKEWQADLGDGASTSVVTEVVLTATEILVIGGASIAPTGEQSSWVVALSPEGDELWRLERGVVSQGAKYDTLVVSTVLTASADGGVLVADSDPSGYGHLASVDAEGHEIWARTLSPVNRIRAMATSSDGQLISTGTLASGDHVVRGHHPDGSIAWTRRLTYGIGNYTYSLTADIALVDDVVVLIGNKIINDHVGLDGVEHRRDQNFWVYALALP